MKPQNKCRHIIQTNQNFEISISIQGSSTVYLCAAENGATCHKFTLTDDGPSYNRDVQQQSCDNYRVSQNQISNTLIKKKENELPFKKFIYKNYSIPEIN